MSFFLFVFLALIIWFVVRPALRVGMAVNRARKQARDFFDAMNGAPSSAGRQRPSSTPSPEPAPRRRKIDPSVAETVEFEEIACNVTSSAAADGPESASASCSRTEAQIVDAEWEDLPS